MAATFVNGKYQTNKIATTPGDVSKAMDEYSNQLYSQGQGKTDIGGKLSGAVEQGAGGDWLGGIASGLAGGMDYMGSSQGKQILAGQSKDQDIANAYLWQVNEEKQEEEQNKKAYGDILSQQEKLQSDMEIAKLAAQGRANQGTGKKIDVTTAATLGKSQGLEGKALNDYIESVVGKSEDEPTNIEIENKRTWRHPFKGETAMKITPPGKKTNVAMTPK